MDISSMTIRLNHANAKNYEDSQQPYKNGDSTNAGEKGTSGVTFVPTDKDVDTNLPVNGKENTSKVNKDKVKTGECQTCKNRKYQDESDDSGVSYQTPTKLGSNVAAAVMGHEQEHVSRNQMKADREGREIVSQSVTLQSAICPECGKSYVSGGTTRTVTRSKPEEEQYNAIPGIGKGENLNTTA